MFLQKTKNKQKQYSTGHLITLWWMNEKFPNESESGEKWSKKLEMKSLSGGQCFICRWLENVRGYNKWLRIWEVDQIEKDLPEVE